MSTLIPWRTRISPWIELDNLQERMDRLFGRPLPSFGPEEPMQWVPAVDLKEAEGEYLLTAEFPGMTEKDVEIEIEQNVLTLRGEKKAEREEEKENGGRWHLVERSWGTFQRAFTLPASIDPAGIRADFDNGLLTVHLPKRQETKGRRISIGKK